MSEQEIYIWSENQFDCYNEIVVRHFMHPKNNGRMEGANGRGRTTSSTIEDFLEISIKVEKDSRKIEQACFRAVGCPAVMACCSILTELISDKTVEEAGDLSAEDICEALGGLPDRKRYCADLSLTALNAAIEDYNQRQSMERSRQERASASCSGGRANGVADL